MGNCRYSQIIEEYRESEAAPGLRAVLGLFNQTSQKKEGLLLRMCVLVSVCGGLRVAWGCFPAACDGQVKNTPLTDRSCACHNPENFWERPSLANSPTQGAKFGLENQLVGAQKPHLNVPSLVSLCFSQLAAITGSDSTLICQPKRLSCATPALASQRPCKPPFHNPSHNSDTLKYLGLR